MKHFTQKLKDGKIQILEVPLPVLGAGTVLVQNHYSLVSAGTEGSTVKTACKGYIGKAKERPQQVKQLPAAFFTQMRLEPLWVTSQATASTRTGTLLHKCALSHFV